MAARVKLCALAMVAFFLLPAPRGGCACAWQWRGSVGVGGEYAQGRFGTATSGNLTTIPVTVTLLPTDRLDFSLEIPYLFQTNGNLTNSVNRDITMQQVRARVAVPPGGGAQQGGGGAQQPVGPTAASGATTTSSNGLGDISVKGGYLLVPEGEGVPALRATLLVKFPTADKEQALGTGAFDEAGTLELSKWFGDWFGFAGMGYTVQGRVAEVELRNYLTASASLGYQLSSNLLPLLVVKATTPAAATTGGTLLFKLKTIWALNDQFSLEGYASKGATPASPDFGFGLALYRSF